MNYINRINRVQKALEKQFCDALLIENKIDLFYLTGLELSAGKMVVSSQNACLIVDKRYFELCQRNSPVSVLPLEDTPWSVLFKTPPYSAVRKLGFDTETTSYQNYAQLLSSLEKSIELIPLQNCIKQLRMIKDETEIQLLRDAAILGAKGFDFVCSLLTEGISENAVACELEIFWKRNRSKGLAFDPIIAFGANSSMPHYRAGNARLQSGQAVLIDIGVNYHHYHSDMTRTLFFGKPDLKMIEIYDIVKGAQYASLELCRPGTLVGDVDEAARAFIREQGYENHFTHSLGHGVGLEIHELPLLRNKPPHARIPLEEGMVITIEPGIYLEGLGGVRLEDTVVITKNGYENLTNRPMKPFF